MLQQIPLTYFRTYTYQPLTGETFGVPLFGFGAAQTPLLTGRHYDPYAMTSYGAARRHDAVSGLKSDVTPPVMAGSGNTLASTTPAPTTTTTSTTTTTTPAPTTTTTTTTTSSTTSAPPTTSTTEEASSTSLRYSSTYNPEYPTYTRRVNNLYNARPQYPYPDYFNYQPQNTLAEKSGTRIQFVPCMCPVSMPSLSSSLSDMGMNSATSSDRDRPTGVSINSSPGMVAAGDLDVPSVEHNMVNIQARHMEGEEIESEEDADTDASVSSASAEDIDDTEPHNTTPTVESNSLV